MILELNASRIITPYAGNTIHTWTNVIGIILISLALGYLLGGRLADYSPKLRNISILLVLTAIYVIGIAYLYPDVLYFLYKNIPDVRVQAFISGLALFSIPSICLAAISPFIAKSVLTNLKNAGSKIGLVYTASTLGSILGTYITGYILIAYFGSRTILLMVSIMLCLLGVTLQIFFKKELLVWFLFIGYLICGLFFYFNHSSLNILVDDESQYQKIWIYDRKNSQGKYERTLATDQYVAQGRSYVNDSTSLVSLYTKYFDLFSYFNPEATNTLMLGGGSYAYPRYFLHKYQNKTMDVVEIDKKITEYAYKYFELQDNLRLNIYHDDARHFMNKNTKKYDVIFIDVFTSASIPYHLMTQEAVKTYYDSLSTDGIVIFNVISSIEGEKKYTLLALSKTFSSIFPKLIILPTLDVDPKEQQNIIIVALKNEDKNYSEAPEEMKDFLSRRLEGTPYTDLPLFTDDYAPIDFYSHALFTKSK